MDLYLVSMRTGDHVQIQVDEDDTVWELLVRTEVLTATPMKQLRLYWSGELLLGRYTLRAYDIAKAPIIYVSNVIELKVRDLETWQDMVLPVHPSAKVMELKCLIAYVFDRNPYNIKVFYRQHTLNDQMSLVSYGIMNGAMVHI